MRTIGVDLAITGQHQAVVVDEQGNAIGRPFRFDTDPAELSAGIKHNRKPAPGISFTEPNLPTLITNCIALGNDLADEPPANDQEPS